MHFHAASHSFELNSSYPDNSSFFASPENRKEMLAAVKNQMRLEKGNDYVGEGKGDKVQSYYKIARHNMLTPLQEYAAATDKGTLEAIYKGLEQTRFNHLIEIRNNMGIYIPVFFFFPFRISIKQNALPIFVGSLVKLQSELSEIQKLLTPEEKIKLGTLTDNFEADEEAIEDYEAEHEGVDHFWAGFACLILASLTKKALQRKTPLFIF